jgi:ribosomal protein S10
MTNSKLIKIYSKDKNSLKHFILLLQKINNKWKNVSFVLKNIKKRRKKVTVLKSPHVNKKAQTQFQAITYSTLIKYSSLEIKKNYILFKKIKNHLFPDIKIKIEQTVLLKNTKTLVKNQFLPKKIYYYNNSTDTKTFKDKQKQKKRLLNWNTQSETAKRLLQRTLQYLKVLDSYGNIGLLNKNSVQVAQLVRAKD